MSIEHSNFFSKAPSWVRLSTWEYETSTEEQFTFSSAAYGNFCYLHIFEISFSTATYSTSSIPYTNTVLVIAVGNLTWGGKGKTPVVEFLARAFADGGISPLILTRDA